MTATKADLRNLFDHSLDGMYFMYFDEGDGLPWRKEASEEEKKLWLDFAFEHLRITEANPAMANMFGLEEPKQIVGRRLKDFFPNSEKGRRYMAHLYDHGTAMAVTQERDRTGKTVWIEGHHRCLYRDGKIIGNFGIQRDITARRERDEEIARRTEELRVLQTMSTAISTTLDAPTIMQLILTRAVDMLEADGGSLCRYDWHKGIEWTAYSIGTDKPVEGLVIPVAESQSGRIAQERQAAILPWEEHHHEGYQPAIRLLPPKHTIVAPMIARDRVLGSVIISRLLVRPPFAERDLSFLSTMAEQVAMALDNAELYATIAASEERYRATLGNLQEVVYSRSVQPEFTMLFISPGIERLTGCPVDAFRTNPNIILDLIEADDRDAVDRKLETLFLEGIEFVAEYRIRNQETGVVHWVRDHLRPRFGSNSTVVAYDGVMVDITEHKQLEAELARARDRAEEANRLKSEFLSNISHELRTPLHGILSYAGFGLKRFERAEREKLRSYFDEIRDSGEQLLTLINDLLDLSKIESGKMEFEFEPVPLAVLVDSIQSKLSNLAESKQIELICPPVVDDWTIGGDRGKLFRVLINLVGNAVKFTPPGGSIRLAVEPRDGGWYRIAVTDNGQGIAAEDLDRIFDKFAQSHSTKHIGGTGLGLAICREIIRAHGGRIWAESAGMGTGSTFFFTLPQWEDTNPTRRG
ncbi:MAG: PAS domain S-box protein [Blastocatellia bacterium]|nr:PAS domain S-box protein [Blastocatellia bacterium]